MTNYERIKAMSAEEMAVLLMRIHYDNTYLSLVDKSAIQRYLDEWTDWLNSEVKEVEE